MVEDPLIRIQHLTHVGICHTHARVFASEHGIDWNDFITNGMLASEVLERTNHHPLAIRIVDYVKNLE